MIHASGGKERGKWVDDRKLDQHKTHGTQDSAADTGSHKVKHLYHREWARTHSSRSHLDSLVNKCGWLMVVGKSLMLGPF